MDLAILMYTGSVIHNDSLDNIEQPHHIECIQDIIEIDDDSDIDPQWERNETTRGFWKWR